MFAPLFITWYQSLKNSSEIMASQSSSTLVINTLSLAVLENLTRDNFCLWKVQVWPAVRGAQLTSFLDGTKKAPAEFIIVQKEDKTEEKCSILSTQHD
jgi:hypothetical protein